VSPRELAERYGVPVVIDDLGDWGTAALVAEYDPRPPTIRINPRALPAGSSCAVGVAIDRAVAHELYHHREAIGEIPILPTRAEREAAAHAYAAALVPEECA
jgi:hypothetical protein